MLKPGGIEGLDNVAKMPMKKTTKNTSAPFIKSHLIIGINKAV